MCSVLSGPGARKKRRALPLRCRTSGLSRRGRRGSRLAARSEVTGPTHPHAAALRPPTAHRVRQAPRGEFKGALNHPRAVPAGGLAPGAVRCPRGKAAPPALAPVTARHRVVRARVKHQPPATPRALTPAAKRQQQPQRQQQQRTQPARDRTPRQRKRGGRVFVAACPSRACLMRPERKARVRGADAPRKLCHPSQTVAF